MPTNRATLQKLLLQIERDVVELSNLKLLWKDAQANLAAHRRQLRAAKTGLKRSRRPKR